MENEIWKSVVGYEDSYIVSDKGNVKSIDRLVNHKKNKVVRKGITRKYNKDISGYLVVNISKKGYKKTVKIHRIVAEAFIPNPDKKPQVNHINGIKTDNSVYNLEWCTIKENRIHAFANGLQKGPLGEKQHLSKLNEKDVLEIRTMSTKKTTKEIANMYKVSRQNIEAILKRKTWKHI